ncbi:MAG: hypothetical protein DI576_01495 [Actinomyces sp.]|nr:MAG: hypothetical protein DI576_01495 [Actinomyces sp.]
MLLPAVLGLVVIAGTTPIGRAPRLMLVHNVGGAGSVDGVDGAVALLGLTLARHQRHITRPMASSPEETRLPCRAVGRGLWFRGRAVGHGHGRGR